MLFWLFVILTAVGFGVFALLFDNFDDIAEFISKFGLLLGVLSGIVSVVMLIVICINHGGVDAQIEKYEARYESLVYQYENDIYDNDNDLGKRELMNDIQTWNEDISYYKSVQKDFWLGIFTPNMYDQFQLIELK